MNIFPRVKAPPSVLSTSERTPHTLTVCYRVALRENFEYCSQTKNNNEKQPNDPSAWIQVNVGDGLPANGNGTRYTHIHTTRSPFPQADGPVSIYSGAGNRRPALPAVPYTCGLAGRTTRTSPTRRRRCRRRCRRRRCGQLIPTESSFTYISRIYRSVGLSVGQSTLSVGQSTLSVWFVA